MFQELLPLLPSNATTGEVVVMALTALVGAILWIMGSRVSRTFVTLIAVGAGGALGVYLPRQLDWDVNTMATAVGGVLVLGLSAFLMHRWWMRAMFAALLAFLAALGTWLIMHGTTPLAWPYATASPREFCDAFWTGLPEDIRHVLPIACGAATLAAAVLMTFFGRIARILHYSLLGTTLVLAMLLWAIQVRKIEWPTFLPGRTDAQIVLVLGMVALGMVVQWQLLPMKRSEPAKSEDAK
jgi:hypothetical protein